jgi:hypothetical protein
MESMGMGCTKYYEIGEIVYVIDSRKVPSYGEIKFFCACITAVPHITIIFIIIVVYSPPVYGLVMGRDWFSLIGGYIMNDESYMMLPKKYGTMVRVPREAIKPISFRKKYNELVQDYIDVGIGNYAVLDPKHPSISKQEGDNSFDVFWKMSFVDACSKSRSGLGIFFKIPNSIIHPHTIRLKFPCTNNE